MTLAPNTKIRMGITIIYRVSSVNKNLPLYLMWGEGEISRIQL